MISRRTFVAGGFAMIGAVATTSPLLSASGGRFGNLVESFARLEKDSDGRLGVAVLDTGPGDSVGTRPISFGRCYGTDSYGLHWVLTQTR